MSHHPVIMSTTPPTPLRDQALLYTLKVLQLADMCLDINIAFMHHPDHIGSKGEHLFFGLVDSLPTRLSAESPTEPHAPISAASLMSTSTSQTPQIRLRTQIHLSLPQSQLQTPLQRPLHLTPAFH